VKVLTTNLPHHILHTAPAIPATAKALAMPDNQEILESVIGFIGSGRGGRKPIKSSPVEFVREVTDGDLGQLANPVPVALGTPAVTVLRNSHHNIARLLAEGRKPGEVATITGYSASRISILQNDPAFAELVHYYAGQAEQQYVDVHSRLAQLGTDTVEVLQDRVLDTAEQLSVKTLLDIASFSLDRSVAPPKRTAGDANGQTVGVGPVVNISFVQPNGRFDHIPLPSDKQAPDQAPTAALSIDLDLLP
jgi:hypothetical protein